MRKRMGRTYEELIEDAWTWVEDLADSDELYGGEPDDDCDVVEAYADWYGIELDEHDNEIVSDTDGEENRQ